MGIDADDAHRQSEERYRVLFDGCPLPILAFDPATLRIVSANAAAVTLYGYDRDELLALGIWDLKVPDQVPELVTGMSGRLHSGKWGNRWTGVRTHRKKDGTLIDASIVAHAITLEDRPTMLMIVEDVTEKRRLQEQLARSHKLEAIGRLAGGIAHDFNNVLAAIVGFTNLALEDLGSDHAVAPDLREVTIAAHRGASLTKQLLLFAGRLAARPEQLSLDATVANLGAMLARLVGSQTRMVTRLAARRERVEADPAQIEQLVVNLVLNACDAMPGGGELTIETTTVELDPARAQAVGVMPRRYVLLSICDTGVGMDEATQARIFEPFFTTKALGKRVGLGLSMVFGIVKASAGGISVHSSLGHGSKIEVYLPIVAVVDDVSAVVAEPRGSLARCTETILVVEDDDQVRAGLRRLLASRGYVVLDAPSADAALGILRRRDGAVDLVLSDLVMPGMNGRDLAVVIASGYPAIRVVLMSGYVEIDDGGAPAGPFIAKPFTPAEMLGTLRRVLDETPAD